MLIYFKKVIVKLIKNLLLSFSSISIPLFLFALTFDFAKKNCLKGSLKIFLIFVFLIVLLAFFAFKFTLRNSVKDDLEVYSIHPIENEIIPTYIGLFVIMMGLGELNFIHQILFSISLVIIWSRIMEQSYYFNLIWLIRYRSYKVEDKNGNVYIIYSKRADFKLHNTSIKMKQLTRVNNFTFIERG